MESNRKHIFLHLEVIVDHNLDKNHCRTYANIWILFYFTIYHVNPIIRLMAINLHKLVI